MAQAKKARRRTRIDKLMPGVLARIHAELDCGHSAASVYRRWNLVRFTLPRNFRLYAAARRSRIKRRGNQRPFLAEGGGEQRVEEGAGAPGGVNARDSAGGSTPAAFHAGPDSTEPG